MWQERYEQVLSQCSLLSDLDLLDDGDMTEVGEGGVTLVSRKYTELTKVWGPKSSHKSSEMYLLSSQNRVLRRYPFRGRCAY